MIYLKSYIFKDTLLNAKLSVYGFTTLDLSSLNGYKVTKIEQLSVRYPRLSPDTQNSATVARTGDTAYTL